METTLLLSPAFCARNILAALTNLHHDSNVVRQKTLKVEQNRIDKILTPGDNARAWV
jgi:hypothetical protein